MIHFLRVMRPPKHLPKGGRCTKKVTKMSLRFKKKNPRLENQVLLQKAGCKRFPPKIYAAMQYLHPGCIPNRGKSPEKNPWLSCHPPVVTNCFGKMVPSPKKNVSIYILILLVPETEISSYHSLKKQKTNKLFPEPTHKKSNLSSGQDHIFTDNVLLSFL